MAGSIAESIEACRQVETGDTLSSYFTTASFSRVAFLNV
ncbi:hypothetical protein SAMN05428959_103554 [Duganella sp. CF517]|nr:hypothetical protein SAMN05428959_103554 [Duganella sp. CF517]